eukprot:GSChrysophyteH1.ASY1.ANO1.2380.1 assembled CDS
MSAPASLVYPKLVVFDLDECVYHPEMYSLHVVPTKNDCVMQRILAGDYPGMRIAAASSADTPLAVRIGRAALELLEVAPGVTVRSVFALGFPQDYDGNMQIGRSPPLSSKKEQTHFPILRRETGVEYADMLFFDDCNWGDNVGNVNRALGVVGQRTPHGLTESDWSDGLHLYAQTRT